MPLPPTRPRRLIVILLISAAVIARIPAEDGGVMPKPLFDPGAADAGARIAVSGDAQPPQVTVSVGPTGIALAIAAGPDPYPGIVITPATGTAWALTAFGHVEATVTNTGAAAATVNLRVDDAGPGEQPWNAESIGIGAGETRTIRIYFGYSYGFRKGYPLKPEAVTRLLFFTTKAGEERSFLISGIAAAGTPGEPVGKHADVRRSKPVDGVLLAGADQVKPGVRGDATLAAEGAQAAFGDGDAVLFLRPAQGLWDLGDHVQASVRLRNAGAQALMPRVRLTSDDGGATAWCSVAKDLAPGEETVVTVPFAPPVPWLGVVDPSQQDGKAKGHWANQPGTGTSFRSHRTATIEAAAGGPGTLAVTAVIAENPSAALPSWLGSRPPVAGAWKQTLAEEFAGDRIDAHRWNVHHFNWWDQRQHFSRDEVVVADGRLALRVEKRTGFHNDDPAGKQTPYAVGWADTYGKWTQRYGYFEVRTKLPAAPCLWPGIWMMPDRGLQRFPRSDPKVDWESFRARNTQDGTGMEFDIVEGQSIWGPHRFNIAMHWDGYGEHHKVVGTSANYVRTDGDGYIVVGMLWTPGAVAMYGNGQEIWRWESPRVSDTQQFLMLQNQLGGWETDALDDSQLPADLLIDYIRVWQRDDLASPDDGAKANRGAEDAFSERP